MADDKTLKAPQDAAWINVHEDYEVRYWTKALGVTPERLRELVREHGVSVDKVRQALSSRPR